MRFALWCAVLLFLLSAAGFGQISYVGQCTGTSTCTPPTHQLGDLFIAIAGRDGSGGSTVTTLPSGWTQVTTQSINGSSTADSSVLIACKVATTTSETAAFNGTNAAQSLAVAIYRGGLSGSTATCASNLLGTPSNNTSATNTTTTTVTYNSITNGNTHSWVIGLAYAPAATAGLGTAPSGMTNRAVQGTTKSAINDTNAQVSSFTSANVTVTTAGRVMTTTMEIKGFGNTNLSPSASATTSMSLERDTVWTLSPVISEVADLTGTFDLAGPSLSVSESVPVTGFVPNGGGVDHPLSASMAVTSQADLTATFDIQGTTASATAAASVTTFNKNTASVNYPLNASASVGTLADLTATFDVGSLQALPSIATTTDFDADTSVNAETVTTGMTAAVNSGTTFSPSVSVSTALLTALGDSIFPTASDAIAATLQLGSGPAASSSTTASMTPAFRIDYHWSPGASVGTDANPTAFSGSTEHDFAASMLPSISNTPGLATSESITASSSSSAVPQFAYSNNQTVGISASMGTTFSTVRIFQPSLSIDTSALTVAMADSIGLPSQSVTTNMTPTITGGGGLSASSAVSTVGTVALATASSPSVAPTVAMNASFNAVFQPSAAVTGTATMSGLGTGFTPPITITDGTNATFSGTGGFSSSFTVAIPGNANFAVSNNPAAAPVVGMSVSFAVGHVTTNRRVVMIG